MRTAHDKAHLIMEFPLSLLLIFYLVMAGLFVIFSIFLVYHALRFGVATRVNIFTLVIYLAGSLFMLVGSYIYIAGIDWGQSIILF